MDKKWCKFVTVVVFAFLASQVNTAAISNDEGNEPAPVVDLGSAIKMFYLAFQRIMPCGYPPMKVPVMAPFTLDYYSFNLTNGFYSASGNVSNLMVTGMNNFNFLGFSYNDTTDVITYDVNFPQMQLLGESQLSAMAYLAGFPAQMANSGLLNLKLIDFRMVGSLKLARNEDESGNESLSITDFNLHFYLADALFNNWNNLWDISGNNFVNKWAREFTLMWTQQIQVQVDQIYAQLLLPNLNGMLNGVSMNDFVDFLVNQTMQLNAAGCTLSSS